MNAATTPELLTVDDVATALRQSRATIYRKLAAGQLESVRLGEPPKAPLRIPAESLWSYVNRGARRAA